MNTGFIYGINKSEMKADLKRLIKRYGGEWVAFNEGLGKVVASGKKAKTVFDRASKKVTGTPFLFKVPVKLEAYVG